MGYRPLPDWVRIRNGSDTPRVIEDRLLPNGKVVLGPGDETAIPRETYRRTMRTIAPWAVNVDVEDARREAERQARRADRAAKQAEKAAEDARVAAAEAEESAKAAEAKPKRVAGRKTDEATE